MKFPCKQWCVLCLVTQSCPTHRNQMDCSLTGSSVHEDSTDKNTGMGCQALLQGIFPTQGSTRSPTLQVNSLPAEPPGKSKNTRVAAYPFSRGSSWPRNQTGVSCIASGFFTNWAITKTRVPSIFRSTTPSCGISTHQVTTAITKWGGQRGKVSVTTQSAGEYFYNKEIHML